MQCLDRFNKKMSLSGGTLRSEYIHSTRELLNETFADDPSYQLGIYFWKLGLKEYEQESPISIRLYGRTYSAANGVTVKFQTLHNTPIIVGDVIYDKKEDEYLICTEAFNIDDIHYKGKFTLCNWMLKWQKKDGTILEYPCYDLNSTQYNSGEQYNKNFTIESSQHMLTLPCDENTVEIANPQRFYLDKAANNPNTYIVTQNDTTSYNYGKKGLVKITVYAHPANPNTDEPDLGICDYIKPNTNVQVEDARSSSVFKTVIECETASITSGGYPQKFTGKFYDDKENEIDAILPHWDIVCDFKDKLQVEISGNCLSMGIDDDFYVGEEFKIIYSDEDKNGNIVSTSLLIKVESLL